jgi:hypothetical protein
MSTAHQRAVPSYSRPVNIALTMDTSIAIELDRPAATPASCGLSSTAPARSCDEWH